MRKRLTLLAAAILPICCGRPERSSAPRHVELCAVAANPGSFDGQLVQLRASVLADGHHGAALFDSRCAELGLGLTYAEGARDAPSVQRLNDAVFRTGRPGTADKEITGLFLGTVRSGTRRLLEIRSIAEFHVAPRPLFWQLKQLKQPFAVPRASSVGSVPSLSSDVASLTIDDIQWDSTPLGLWPLPRSERAKRLQVAGKTAVPLLREALHDPWRFAAAHVFLTWASEAQFELSASEYNGMVITLESDGRARIPDQRVKLQDFWSRPEHRGP